MNKDKIAQQYIDAGFGLCSTRSTNQKEAYGVGWQKTGQSSGHWRTNPDDGMGIVHGLSGTCSIDLDDLERAHVALEAVCVDLNELLKTAVQINSGRENRAKMLFKLPPGAPAKRHALNWRDETGKPFCVLELRAGSVHDVLPPSIHPDTGKPYQWIGDWRNLPTLPVELANLWCEWELAKSAMMEADPNHVETRRPPANVKLQPRNITDNDNVIGQFNDAYDIGDLLSQHGYKYARGRWLAPNSSTGIPGVVKLPDSAPLHIYSFHGSDILCDGYAHDAFSVFTTLECHGDVTVAVSKAAGMMGIKPKIDKEVEVVLSEIKKNMSNVVSIKAVEAEIEQEVVEAPNPGVMPVDCGADIVNWIRNKVPEAGADASIQAALSVMSTAVARRYSLSDGKQISLMLGVSDSSKSRLIGLGNIAQLMITIDLIEGYRDDAQFSSGTALKSGLAVTPNLYWYATSLVDMLSRTKRSHNGSIMAALDIAMSVIRGMDVLMRNPLGDDSSGRKPLSDIDRVIHNPRLTVLSIMSDYDIGILSNIGGISRFCMEQMLSCPAGEVAYVRDKPSLKGVISTIKSIKSREDDLIKKATRNNPGMPNGDISIIKIDEHARPIFDDCESSIKSILDDDIYNKFCSLGRGYYQSARRIAGVLSAWDDPYNPVITESHATWASLWVKRCLLLTLPLLSSGAGDSGDAYESVLYMLGTRDAMTGREMRKNSRVFRKLNKEEQMDLLSSMVEDGIINITGVNRSKNRSYSLARKYK